MNKTFFSTIALTIILTTSVNAVMDEKNIEQENIEFNAVVDVVFVNDSKSNKSEEHKFLKLREKVFSETNKILSILSKDNHNYRWNEMKDFFSFVNKNALLDCEFFTKSKKMENKEDVLNNLYLDLKDEQFAIEKKIPLIEGIDQDGNIYKTLFSIYNQNREALSLLENLIDRTKEV